MFTKDMTNTAATKYSNPTTEQVAEAEQILANIGDIAGSEVVAEIATGFDSISFEAYLRVLRRKAA